MRKIIILFLAMFTFQVFASDEARKAFAEGTDVAQHAKGKTAEVVRNLDVDKLPAYHSHTEQEKYYKGETQVTDDLLKDAATEKEKSATGSLIEKSSQSRKQYTINKNLPEMQRAKFIIDNSGNIAQGIDSSQVKCEDGKAKKCEVKYTNEICSESTRMEDVNCTKDLTVNVAVKTVSRDITISFREGFTDAVEKPVRYMNGLIYFVDLSTGSQPTCKFDYSHEFPCRAEISGNLQDLLRNDLQVEYLGYEYVIQPSWQIVPGTDQVLVDVVEMPNYANGFHVRFNTAARWKWQGIKNDAWLIATTKLKFRFTANDYSFSDSWSDNCSVLRDKMQHKMCVFKSEDCSQGKQTRLINHVPVTRDCWQKTDAYTCSQGTTDNNCESLRARKCDQIDSRCSKFLGDICLVYEQTYRCPVTHCEDLGIVCGGDTFCLSGNCTDHSYKSSADFAKNLSALAALAAAQKDRQGTGTNFTVFSGQIEKCAEKDPVSFIDCCSDSGWGKDAGLARCAQAEKDLAEHKARKLTVEVGEYCSQYVFGTHTCWLYKKSYCLFHSKLARIIQQFGRRDQLGIGFGDPEDPDCRGLTPAELQRIDFSKIDFSDFTEDLKERAKEPDRKQTEDRLKDRAEWCFNHPNECKLNK